MLARILSLLSEGTSHSTADLARRLGVSEQIVDDMVSHLASLGYLYTTSDTCRVACAACPLAGSCSTQVPSRLWALTEKGTRAVQQSARE